MVTALARLEGRPVGHLANDTMHLAGAITSDGSDKATRFLAAWRRLRLPVVSLVDTPGFMVGPETEATGLVRHGSRMLVAGAALRCRWWRSCCAAATGWARRRWSAAACTSRC
jgi:acetyl-CoA carboxylase carboxyltransferase component